MELICILVAVVVVAAVILFKRKKQGESEVPQGLQIFNASGELVLDYTDETFEVYGYRETTAGQSGTIVDNRITTNTMIVPYSYVFVTEATPGTVSYDQSIMESIFPKFTVNSGSITWEYAPKHTPDGTQWRNGDAYIQVGFLYGGSTV